jgi:hypothetical protein
MFWKFFYNPTLCLIRGSLELLRQWHDSFECETWSVEVREVRTIRVFENRILRGIFGPKMGGDTADWRG